MARRGRRRAATEPRPKPKATAAAETETETAASPPKEKVAGSEYAEQQRAFNNQEGELSDLFKRIASFVSN